MTPIPAYAGIVVSDLDASAAWYSETLGCRLSDEGARWTSLAFADGSIIELFEGDRRRPGSTFPSYGADPGPAVLPGYAVEDPGEAAAGLTVARRLPDWLVVIAPDGLRVVLAARESDGASGLVGFDYCSEDPAALESFLTDLGVPASVDKGQAEVVIRVRGPEGAQLGDPDGTRVVVVASPGT
ncbi:MAG TPA: VOC family protein [Egibacteraceae bacterium]|nr:VOC family protein [Egibacteraceae bacterium]